MDTNKKELFIKDINSFIVQTINGCYMNAFRFHDFTKDNDISKTVTYFICVYLNQCYHQYWRKSDDFVIKSFNDILSHKIINGSVCLIYWLYNISQLYIMFLNFSGDIVQYIRNMNEYDRRNFINFYIMRENDRILGVVKDNIGSGCEGDCIDNYDGTDIFKKVSD